MREVKFRGKMDGVWWYFIANDGNEGEWSQFWGLVDRKTVGQSLIIKDKNGKEIYEGDIVKCLDGYSTTVSYDEQHAQFNPFGSDENAEWGDGVEVIGNIYDDPELSEEKS